MSHHTRDAAGTPREQQLLVRTVQQEVELRALRTRVRLLETKCRKYQNNSPTRRGNSPPGAAAAAAAAADGSSTSAAAGAADSVAGGADSSQNQKQQPGTQLMSPVVAEEIIADPDGLARVATHHHTAVVLGSSIYVFGGQHQPDARGFASMEADMWSFSLEKRAWNRVEVQGPALRGRCRHTAVGYKGSMFVYGGTALSHGAPVTCNTLHTFSPASCRWFNVPLQPAGEPLADHTAVVVQDIMYIFGGINGGGRNNVVRGIDLSQRTWLDAQSLNPQIARTMMHHAASSSSGADGSSPPGGDSPGGAPASESSPVRGAIADVPAPRSSHSAVTWHKIVHSSNFGGATVHPSMVVFGGLLAAHTCANDCFVYNYNTSMWARLFCGGVVPDPRCDHTAACVREWMFVCGGMDPGVGENNHTLSESDDASSDEDNDGTDLSGGSEDDDDDNSDAEEDDDKSGSDDKNGDNSELSGNSSNASDTSSAAARRRRRRRRALRKKKEQRELERRKRNRSAPHLFHDVFALNLAQSVWTRIEITSLAPTLLSQCGHASILYQSPEQYIAMLTFGGVTVVADEESNGNGNGSGGGVATSPVGGAKAKKTIAASGAGAASSPASVAEKKKGEKAVAAAAAADTVASTSVNTKPAADEQPSETLNCLLRHHRQAAAKQLEASKNKKKDDSKSKAAADAAAAAKKKKTKKKVYDPYDETLEHVVGGGIFVMRLISTKGENKNSNSVGGTGQQVRLAGGGISASGSMSRRRPHTIEVMNDENDDGSGFNSSSRPQSAAGTRSRPTSARVLRAEQERQQSQQRRWLSTGSHVDLAPKESKDDGPGGNGSKRRAAAGNRRLGPRPPSAKRTEEEINRFFCSLNDRTEEQLKKAKTARAKYFNPPVEAPRFETEEEQQASVSRLYFDSLQHLENTRAELEEKFSPRNPSKIVSTAVIGEAVERLYAGARPPSPARDKATAARDSPTPSSNGGRRSAGSRPGSAGPARRQKPYKPRKKITPQEEKAAVERLYSVALEFRKRMEKDLIEKHLFQGYKSPARVDAAALVNRLYPKK